MAITLNGSTIEIDSGVASGTATGGSANTLTGSGFGAWANQTHTVYRAYKEG